ncbi:MAG: Luciferase-like, subgroup [Aeromicrobium sp.]|nr:Luciferase-like, subgroup [Aeromicrobium sp.]
MSNDAGALQLGIVCGNVGPDAISSVREVPVAAEELGFCTAWFTDHVIGLKAYQPVYRPEWAESLTSLAWAAARTSTIQLGVGVLVAPLRDPVYAAKAIATIDQLAGGRIVMGIGTGWAYREYEALGRAALFERRGAATNEAIDVMKRCWQGGTFGFDGAFTSFKEIEFAPTPPRAVPLWIGGDSGPAIRRAAKYADVWHPARLSAALVAQRGEQIDEAAGRPVERSIRLAYTAQDRDEILATVEDYLAVGCRHVVVEPKFATTAEIVREAEVVASRLLG